MREHEQDRPRSSSSSLLPLVAVVLALAWQLVLAGHAAWAVVRGRGRAAARAAAVGGDPARPPRAPHLPRRLERGLRVRSGGRARVGERAASRPSLPPVRLGRVRAEAGFPSQ